MIDTVGAPLSLVSCHFAFGEGHTMTRFHWVVLVTVGAVLVNADANFASDSKLSLRSDPSDVYLNRFLRVHSPDDEERAGVSVSILEKAKALFGPAVVPPKLMQWLSKGKPADQVFVRLGLNKAKDQLFEAPKFLLWAKYVDTLSSEAPTKGISMIPTLTAQYGDEALTQMIIAAKSMTNSETKKVASRMQSQQIFNWVERKKAPDDVFNWFKLNKAGDDLLSSPNFATWNNYLRLFNQEHPDLETTLLAVLTKSYGEAGVAKILQQAMKVPETAATARRLDTDLVQRWLTSGKSTDEVFALLNLNTAGDKLFSNPLLVTWTKYMNAFNQKHPDRKASLAATLAKHYGDEGVSAMLKSGDVSKILANTKSVDKLFDNRQFLVWLEFVEDPRRTRMATSLMTSLTTKYGDEALIKVIEAAMKVDSTKLVATKLQAQQFKHWAAIGKSPDDVFKLFSLNKAGDSLDNLLSSPRLETWKTYLKVYNQQNPKEQTSLVAAMSKSYGDEAVLKMLESAKGGRRSAVKRLESEQMQRWMTMAPDEVFKALNLDTAAEKMFGSSPLNAWGKYAASFNAANPDKKTSLIGVLTTSYGDDGVVALLAAAKKVPGSEAVATRLQTEQIQRWLSNDKPPHEIFPLLQLDKAGDKLFASPQFSTWIKYVDDFGNKNIGTKPRTIETMRYFYEDDVLAKMILTAEKNPSTKKMAQRADDELMKGWINGVYTPGLNNPDEVFQTLKLDQLGDKVLESPLFGYFSRYVDRYNQAYSSKKTTMLSALSQRHEEDAVVAMIGAAKKNPSTEKLATKLQAEQIDDWLAHTDPPDEIFNTLKLDKSADNLLTNPSFDTWATYMQEFNAKYPDQKDSMIDIFRATFGDKDLAKMLIAAKEVPDTKKVATDLQTALLNDWVRDKATTAAVSKVLTAGGVAESTKATLLAEYAAKLKETLG